MKSIGEMMPEFQKKAAAAPKGKKRLKAAEVICPPALRPATIILVAMLGAKGHSTLRNVYSINRGYEDIVQRLQALGAHIESN